MRLAIPTLQLDTSILLAPIEEQTWKVNHLEQAVGHLEGTAHAGANSNMVLAGHVTLPPDGRAGPFVNLKRLAPNDTVIVYNQGQAFTYQIDYLITVKSTDVHVTYPSSEPRLTLITCLNYDRVLGRYTDRLVAVGHLIDN
jgi:sortase A